MKHRELIWISLGLTLSIFIFIGLTLSRTVVAESLVSRHEETPVKVFWSTKDRQGVSCEAVESTVRFLPKGDSLAESAIEALLLGPTEVEKEAGLFTNINAGTKLQKFSLRYGHARADFNAEFGKGVAGSCRVIAIRSQIESTLKQFKGIKRVTISIDGQIEGILEP